MTDVGPNAVTLQPINNIQQNDQIDDVAHSMQHKQQVSATVSAHKVIIHEQFDDMADNIEHKDQLCATITPHASVQLIIEEEYDNEAHNIQQ